MKKLLIVLAICCACSVAWGSEYIKCDVCGKSFSKSDCPMYSPNKIPENEKFFPRNICGECIEFAFRNFYTDEFRRKDDKTMNTTLDKLYSMIADIHIKEMGIERYNQIYDPNNEGEVAKQKRMDDAIRTPR